MWIQLIKAQHLCKHNPIIHKCISLNPFQYSTILLQITYLVPSTKASLLARFFKLTVKSIKPVSLHRFLVTAHLWSFPVRAKSTLRSQTIAGNDADDDGREPFPFPRLDIPSIYVFINSTFFFGFKHESWKVWIEITAKSVRAMNFHYESFPLFTKSTSFLTFSHLIPLSSSLNPVMNLFNEPPYMFESWNNRATKFRTTLNKTQSPVRPACKQYPVHYQLSPDSRPPLTSGTTTASRSAIVPTPTMTIDGGRACASPSRFFLRINSGSVPSLMPHDTRTIEPVRLPWQPR